LDYFLHILVDFCIFAILAMSLDIIVGYTGIPALGHVAFALTGAYTSSLLALNLNFPPLVGMIIGGIVASLVGAIVSYPAIKLKGDYLALATFGFGVIAYVVAKNWVSLTRGPMGLPGIPTMSVFGIELNEEWQYLIFALIIAAITFLLLTLLVSRPFGRVLKATREDEQAAQAMGKNTPLFKLKVFMSGAFFAGIAGALYAHKITFIDPSSFTVMHSITILLMVIFGGMGTLKGAVLGAFLLIVIPESLRFVGISSSVDAQIRQMLYGLILVVLMIYRPQGIIGKIKWR
jgi:branched-chain amino acid transport system permease protein